MTVLIIEDNQDNMTLISDILQLNGYETIWANTGNKGIQLANEIAPEFIILDIQLPDIDGYGVLDSIRKKQKTQSVPVIAMTSYAMPGDRERLLSSGCNGYVEKPINPAIVMDQIKLALG